MLESRGEYVLIELPSFFYFSTLSIYVIVWYGSKKIRMANFDYRAVSMRSTLDVGKETRKMLYRITAIANAVIYIIFILLIILYETLRPTPTTQCNGLLVTYDITTRYMGDTTRGAISDNPIIVQE